MYIHFAKKNLFLRLINCILLISFVFTGIPVEGYAGIPDSDSLRKPAAEKDGSAAKIKDELTNTGEKSAGDQRSTVFEQLEKIYEEKGADMDDYYVPALVVVGPDGKPVAKVKKGDVVIWINHRTDRSLEAMFSFTDPAFNKHGNRFDVEDLGLTFVPFTVYDDAYFNARGIQAAFTSKFTLPSYKSVIEVLQQAGVMQGYFTESDKGQHVTYFFAGQRNLDYASLGIKVSIVRSEGVDDKKKNPKMKYDEITDNVINYLNEIKGVSKKKVIVVNLPVDIQGHNIKGNTERAKQTVLAADEAAGRIREAILSQKGVYIETSDHGNIEKLATLDENGMPVSDKYGLIPFDQHTANPVNFIIDGLGKNIKLKQGKGLSNIAATLLEILGISKPEEMDESLLSGYQYQNVEGPMVLVIRDGWGVNKFKNKEAKENNGIELAQPPVFLDLVKNCPRTILKAHGDAVGLPDYQMGDSDNGHRVIGTGFNPSTLYKQIIDQIDDRSFFENPVLCQAFESAKKQKRDIHIIGLYSVGGIHSDNRYFLALMEMAKQMNFDGKVNIWPILDGRDVMTRIPTESGIFYLKQIQNKISELKSPNIQLAGAIGRNYAMDRDAINNDRDADKKERLAETKAGVEADKLKQEAVDSRKLTRKIWEERFKVAYRLWVNGEGITVKLGLDGGEKKTNILAEAENIISGSKGKIKAALFDIGGVLLDYPRSSVVNKFQKVIKLKSGKEIAYDEIEKLIFTGESAQQLRLGLPIEDFVDELNGYMRKKLNSPGGFELKEFMDILFLDYEPPLNMVELVRDLSGRGMPIYVLSNNFISNKFNVKELIKDKLNSFYSKQGEKNIFTDNNLIMSNEIGVAKPNKMAFNQALEKIRVQLKANLNSNNILFFDDQWENAGVANQLGFYTFGLNEEVSGVMNFLDAQSRVFNAVGGKTVFLDYLKKVDDEISKLRGSITDHKVALIVHASFVRKGGALDSLREVLQLKPFVKLGIYGKGADKLAALFSQDKDVIATATLDEMVAALNNRGGVARSKDIVVLRPSETLDPDWKTLKQVGFSKEGISTVDVAKAMEALVGTPGTKEAFKKFYGELKDRKIITTASYDATKDKMSTESTAGVFDLPQIEPEQKVSEIITRESEAVTKFVDKYI